MHFKAGYCCIIKTQNDCGVASRIFTSHLINESFATNSTLQGNGRRTQLIVAFTSKAILTKSLLLASISSDETTATNIAKADTVYPLFNLVSERDLDNSVTDGIVTQSLTSPSTHHCRIASALASVDELATSVMANKLTVSVVSVYSSYVSHPSPCSRNGNVQTSHQTSSF